MSFQNIYTDKHLTKQTENYGEYGPLLRLIPKQKFDPEEFDIEKEARIRKRIIAEIKAEREKEQRDTKGLPIQAVVGPNNMKQNIEAI